MTATIEDLRVLRFDAHKDDMKLTRKHWMDRAANHYPMVAIGVGMLGYSDEELAARLAEFPDEMCLELS